MSKWAQLQVCSSCRSSCRFDVIHTLRTPASLEPTGRRTLFRYHDMDASQASRAFMNEIYVVIKAQSPRRLLMGIVLFCGMVTSQFYPSPMNTVMCALFFQMLLFLFLFSLFPYRVCQIFPSANMAALASIGLKVVATSFTLTLKLCCSIQIKACSSRDASKRSSRTPRSREQIGLRTTTTLMW